MIQEKLFRQKIDNGQLDHANLLISSDESILNGQIDYLQNKLGYNRFEIVKIAPEDKKNGEITIGMIKSLRSELSNRASSGKRLVIINAAHKINAEAANSFLKTLEEPPKDTTIVMLSESRDILPTLVSRSQVYSFPALKRSYQEFQPEDIDKIFRLGLKERFAMADKIVKDGRVEIFLEDLLTYYHGKLKNGERVERIIEVLLCAQRHFQANVVAKLIVENVMLILS